MNKAEKAIEYFDLYNCAQAVLSAYAADYDLEKDKALQVAVGFGGGLGGHQDVCGAISGAISVLGLHSGFKEEDRREKIRKVYAEVYRYINEFTEREGTIKCRELLNCDLNSDEGKAFYREHNLKDQCRGYVRLCCELLDKYLAEA